MHNLEPLSQYVIQVFSDEKQIAQYNYQTLPDESYDQPYNVIYSGDVGSSAVAD